VTAHRPDPFALTPEERQIRDTVREFAQRELAPTVAQRDEEERYDRSLFERMSSLGLTGLPYPEEFGGAGMGTFAWILACEDIAVADMGMAISLSVHILAQLPILTFGSEEQKRRFLPQMTAGRHLGAFALTEPGAGSDAAALALLAERTDEGYALSGSKIWITNGQESEVTIVFATVDRSRGRDAITAFVVERDTPGFRVAGQEMIQAMLADAATRVEASRLLTWRAARLRDAGGPINAPSSMAKMFASDTAMQVTTDAVQIYGGAGYSRDNPVERLMRDAKGAQIYEGTNQIHRLIVAQQFLEGLRRG